MHIRPAALTPLILLGAALLGGPASAEPDLFGREGLYDLTGDALVDDLRPDLAYINGEVPSYAERLGRVGAPAVEIRPNYIYVEDQDSTFPTPFQRQRDVQTAFNFALREVYRALPDEFVFVYLFTSFDTNVGAFFYAPEANDVWGINAQGQFDSNGTSPREGFIFMNYWRSFEELFGPGAGARGQSRSVFNQEAGHRWGAFVTAGAGGNGAGPDVLRGRDDSHWSYFLHTGGSPMEGNSWRDNGNGTFTTQTGFDNYLFSDLDLYLMGLMPPEEVQPFFVIDNPSVSGERDLYRQQLNPSSPPQIVQPKTISGTRVDLGIEDVIARNGTRNPPYGEAPTSWRVVFVMLASSQAPLSESQKAQFDRLVEDYADGFHEATLERGTLDYQLTEPVEPLSPVGGACDVIDDCDPQVANFCVPNPFTPTGICTASCGDASACPVDWCCSDVQNTAVPVCLPAGLCPTPNPCACDATPDTCDEGCACDMACEGNTNNNAGGNNGNNNAGNGNNNGAGNGNGGGNPGLCECDLTYSCDAAAEGSGADCPCDPECDAGCGCTETTNGASAPAGLVAGLLLGLTYLRRRRRR